MKTLATIIAGVGIVLSSILPLKNSYAQTKINPFVQPNDSTLNWYGSGDVNNDNKLTLGDATRLDSLINKKFSDKKDKRLNDRADVNGDGKVDSTDKQTLEDYLNKKINYLPGQGNKLKTREERLDWFKKMLTIDKTDTLKGIPGEWISGNFAAQIYINFHGHQGTISSKYSPEDNGRFNLPLCDVRIINPLHGASAILVGDNPLNWDNWYFNEPQNDTEIKPGNWNLSKDSKVEIFTIKEFDKTGSGYGPNKFIIFELKDSIPSLSWYSPELQLTREIDTPVEEDKHENVVPTDFDLKQNYPNPFNPTTTIKYELPKNEKVTLKIYNIKGQELETLVNKEQSSGAYEIKWDASKYASGIYFYRMQAGRKIKVQKMTLIK